MSHYFDNFDRKFGQAQSNAERAILEAEMIRDVCLVTGDIEFPDEHRQEIMGIIAVSAIYPEGHALYNERTEVRAEATKRSVLSTRLHSAFHALARKRIRTRFGVLSDNPDSNLARRVAHLEEQEKAEEEEPIRFPLVISRAQARREKREQKGDL